MAITIGARPADIDGCWGSWEEKQDPNVIRTDMEATGYVKVRRRTTGITRRANVSRVFEAKHFDDVMRWFNVDCQGGVRPTRIVTPTKKEEVWRFTEPFTISWVGPDAFQASVMIEQLPAYRGL